MREIKFRGREKESNKWVFGYARHWKCCFGDEWHIQGENDNVHIVIPETVGQFTGLKDCKGQEIYEGDVFRDPDGRTLEVVWNNGAGSWECVREDYHFLFIMRYIDLMTVIGNVHDNPELLEVEA